MFCWTFKISDFGRKIGRVFFVHNPINGGVFQTWVRALVYASFVSGGTGIFMRSLEGNIQGLIANFIFKRYLFVGLNVSMSCYLQTKTRLARASRRQLLFLPGGWPKLAWCPSGLWGTGRTSGGDWVTSGTDFLGRHHGTGWVLDKYMGLLPDMQIVGCACTGNAGHVSPPQGNC